MIPPPWSFFAIAAWVCLSTGALIGALGGVISPSLVGASPDYVDPFFHILPGAFNPERYQPEKWAALARLAGFEYVTFTTKHHAG